MRDWPFVLFAVLLLVAGLFIERFYCRYLCPLGAALAIPGRVRVNDWLKRYRDCGSPCHRCANECMVQAIHPDGHIDPNECLYCLHCQELYYDDQNCSVMIQKLARFERRMALQSGSKTSRPQTKTETTSHSKPSSASCGSGGCGASCSNPKSSDGNNGASNQL
jgi:NosR/NirI family nitrous oxide reductase transcriptional regulator